MKFFNLDLHVSVIEDVSRHFRSFGYTVDSHLMSGHHWALGKPRASKGTGEGPPGKVGYGSINLTTWESLFHDCPEYAKAAAWQKEHPELDEYDGFIATYPPAFALLYERFRGKVVIDIPIRYDLHFTHRPDAWQDFNDRLHQLHDAGRLVVVANNRYDGCYFNYFTGLPWKHISSTCDYIDELAPKWKPTGQKLLSFGEHAGGREAAKRVKDVVFVRDVLPQYQHAQISMARGIVWFPYNCSIMSFFEHYWLNIPLFVPTEKFLEELAESGLALTQLSWHSSLLNGSNLPMHKRASVDLLPDPHTAAGVRRWMALYDFYNVAEFPYITYFSSWNDLQEKIATVNFEDVSAKMAKFNVFRRARNLEAWKVALAA